MRSGIYSWLFLLGSGAFVLPAHADTSWLISDPNAPDLTATVKVACPGGTTLTLDNSNGTKGVRCDVPAGTAISLYLGDASEPTCVAHFDAKSEFIVGSPSTCHPDSGALSGKVLTFDATAGITPPVSGLGWTINDSYPGDYDSPTGVAVSCPGGVTRTLNTAQDSVTCNIPPNSSLTLTSANGASCMAVFDANSKFITGGQSTCQPVAGALVNKTLSFANDRGIQVAVAWTITDAYAGDYSGSTGVAVVCPGSIKKTLETKASSVTCNVPAGSSVTLLAATGATCVAHFDDTSGFIAGSPSTCEPLSDPLDSNTLSFDGSAGVQPIANILNFDFPDPLSSGFSATCTSGCGNKIGIASSRLLMNESLDTNGTMTLEFSTKTPAVSCMVSLVDQFVDDRNTTCKSVSLTTIAAGNPENLLAFQNTDGVGYLTAKPAPVPGPAGTQIGTRRLSFINQCNHPVWLNLVSGTVGPPRKGDEVVQKGNLCNPPTSFSCPAGTSCRYATDKEAYCYFDLPAPIGMASLPLDAYKLDAANSSKPNTVTTKTIEIPIYDGDGGKVIFSGGASARVGCYDEATGRYNAQCSIGNCNESNNALGCGFTTGTGNGATIAEFTFQRDAIDYYDVSVINGAHIPVTMAPAANPAHAPRPGDITGYYWCGNPGSTGSVNNQPACDWNFSSYLPTKAITRKGPIEKYFYVNVEKPASVAGRTVGDASEVDFSKLTFCAGDGDCGDGLKCGLSLGLLSVIKEERRADLFGAKGLNDTIGPFTCGARLGFSTPVNACALLGDETDDGYFNCGTIITQDTPGNTVPKSTGAVPLTYNNFYSCNGATDNCIKSKSTYSDESKVCCGCTTWDGLGLAIESGQRNASGDNIACTFNGNDADGNAIVNGAEPNTNPYWDGTATKSPDVEGKLKFLKQACPSAYVYQFDDATATFNCCSDGACADDSGDTINLTNYDITFCSAGGGSIQ